MRRSVKRSKGGEPISTTSMPIHSKRKATKEGLALRKSNSRKLSPTKRNLVLEARSAANRFKKISRECEETAEGYRAKLYGVAAKCYSIGLGFMKDKGQFHRFMSTEFLSGIPKKQKPADNQQMKAVLTFVFKANTKQRQNEVLKLATILDAFARENVEPSKIVCRFKAGGGIEKLYRDFTKRTSNSRIPDDLEFLLHTPERDAETEDQDQDGEETAGWPAMEGAALAEDQQVTAGEAAEDGTDEDSHVDRSAAQKRAASDSITITDFGGQATPPKAPTLAERFDENKHLLIDLGEIGMSPEAAMELKGLSILAVVGPPDQFNFRPIIAKSVKQAPLISGIWKKSDSGDDRD